jgi:hypothetical protein
MNSKEPSLLSHIQQERKKTFDEGGISSIILCVKVKTENDISNGLQLHRKIVEDEVNKEGSNVTGLLMGQGNSILHLLEGPSFALLRILEGLAQNEQFLDPFVQSGRIAYIVEDRPQRYWPEWFSCTVQEKKSPIDDITAETCNDIIHDLAQGLFEIGNGLQSTSHELFDISQYSEKIPGKNLTIAISNSSLFMTLEEFVYMYVAPYHLDLESESTWPVERVVNY